jgi:hypothetical protein
MWQFAFEKRPLLASAVVSVDAKECRFLNLQGDGSSCVNTVTYGVGCRSSSGPESSPFQDFKVCPVFRSSIVIVGPDSVILRASGITKVSLPSVQFLCLTNDVLVFLSEEGSLFTLRIESQSERKVCSILYERPVALGAHSDFDLLVVATLERHLLFYSLSSGIFRTRADLAGELVVQILVTDGWGFVVVLTNESIHVFNVNGIRIRRVPNSKRIVLLCTWKSPSGFDYLCGSDNRGRMMVSEAFYANFETAICCVRVPVQWVNYLANINCLSAVTTDGKGFLIPCPAFP